MLDVVRRSPAGVWHRMPDGTGALVIDPALLESDGGLNRLVARVVAVRGLALPGVVPVADLAEQNGRILMLAAVPVTPTVMDLVGAHGSQGPGASLDAGSAAAIADDTARALVALHSAGHAHGALSPDAVVVTATGQAQLNEVGIATALQGRDAPTTEDARAWAALVRMLVNAWVGADDEAANVLSRAAATAETVGLETALDQLHAHWDSPVSGPSRDALSARATPATSTAQSSVPVPTALTTSPSDSSPSDSALPDSAPRQMATLLGHRAGSPSTPRVPKPAPAAAAPSAAAAVPPVETGVLRFGPGAPAAPGVADTWKARPAPRRRRRMRAVRAALLTLVVVAGALAWLWWQRGGPLSVTGVNVAPATDPANSCDVTVDVVGTIHTDGLGGVVTYQWLRNDGQTSEVLQEIIPPGRDDAVVHLRWSLTGEGTYHATATLSVLAPDPIVGSTEFTYDCR
jgi:hypothetical protein